MGQFLVFGKIEFWIYIHDIGEEYFLHYDYWPDIPNKYQVKKEDVAIDITIRKQIQKTDENCNTDERYSYFGMYIVL